MHLFLRLFVRRCLHPFLQMYFTFVLAFTAPMGYPLHKGDLIGTVVIIGHACATPVISRGWAIRAMPSADDCAREIAGGEWQDILGAADDGVG